jgi:hypothetical protein
MTFLRRVSLDAFAMSVLLGLVDDDSSFLTGDAYRKPHASGKCNRCVRSVFHAHYRVEAMGPIPNCHWASKKFSAVDQRD